MIKLNKYFVAICISVFYVYIMGAWFETNFDFTKWGDFTRGVTLFAVQLTNFVACMIASERK